MVVGHGKEQLYLFLIGVSCFGFMYSFHSCLPFGLQNRTSAHCDHGGAIGHNIMISADKGECEFGLCFWFSTKKEQS